MNKNILVATLLSLLLLVSSVPIALAHDAPFPTGYRYEYYTIDVTGNPASLDPSWAYDTTAAGVIMNVYENLIFYDPLWEEGPYQPPLPAKQRISEFVPQLASDLPTIDHTGGTTPISGLHWYSKFTFPIREGIQFHHGVVPELPGDDGLLHPEDVEYSIERVLVQDRVGGPAWLLFEPLLNAEEADGTDPDFGLKIDGCVQVDGNNVIFYLAGQYPDTAFLQILGQSWSCIMSEAWAVWMGDLNLAEVPGGWTNWSYIFGKWHAPSVSKLQNADGNAAPLKDGGTGPYMVSYWTRGTAWSISKYDDYLAPNENQGRPASWPCPVEDSTAALGGYLDSITWYIVVSWPTRLDDLLTGRRDTVAVPRSYRDQALGQIVGGEPIRSYYPITSLSGYAMYFGFNLASTAYPSYVPNPLAAPNTFDENSIPPNIFGIDTVTGRDEGLNVRKGFAAAWDYGYAISAGNLDEAFQPATPIVDGLPYYNASKTKPDYSITKAQYYLRLAWGGLDDRAGGVHSTPVLPEDPNHVSVNGSLWNNGMRFYTVYNTGAVVYMLAQDKMNSELNAMNPRFHLSSKDVDWGTVFLPAQDAHELPVYNVGWLADFADEHNFAYPFMHSHGTFGLGQCISVTVTANGLRQVFMDDLIGQGIVTPNTGTFTHAAVTTPDDWVDRDKDGTRDVGDWFQVDGIWYEQQTDGTGSYFRQKLYEELMDLYVEEVPSTMVFQSIGRGFQCAWVRGFYDNKLYPGNFWYHWWKAKTHFGDVNWDGMVGGADWTAISAHWTGPPEGPGSFNPRADLTGGTGGTSGSETGLVRGIPDGRVTISDLSLVSAYWDTPHGPQHGPPWPS